PVGGNPLNTYEPAWPPRVVVVVLLLTGVPSASVPVRVTRTPSMPGSVAAWKTPSFSTVLSKTTPERVAGSSRVSSKSIAGRKRPATFPLRCRGAGGCRSWNGSQFVNAVHFFIVISQGQENRTPSTACLQGEQEGAFSSPGCSGCTFRV